LSHVSASEQSEGIDHSSFGQPCNVVLADGKFVDKMDARVGVHAHALSYGTGTYDGIRAFWNPAHENLYLLEARAHYDRMHASARILGLSLPYPAGDLVDLTAELLRRNQVKTDAYVRPILFQSGPVL
jgi:branched-chain amino acid aminotransferase